MILRSRQNERCNPLALRHTHADEHELLLVESGRGRQLIGDAEVPCRPGEIYFFPPHQPHLSYCRKGEAFDCLILICNSRDLSDGQAGDGGRQLLEALTASVPSGGRLTASAAARQKAHRLLLRAMTEQRGALAGSAVAVRCLATEALLVLARDSAVTGPRPRSQDASADQHVRRAQEFLVNHADQPIRLYDLLALGSLGRSRFLAHYRKLTGSTISADLFAARLGRAKHMLTTTSMAVVDVALACGFGSQSHFTHRFTEAMGLPPGEWRSQLGRSGAP